MIAGSLLESIHRTINSLYQGPVRTVAVRTGIHSILRDLYGRSIVALFDDVQVRKVGNTTVVYDTTDYSAWNRQRDFQGEIPVMTRFAEDVADASVVWDVGANMGTYACLAGKAAEDVTVVTFEPAPENVARLKRNLDLNNIKSIIQEKALDETNGEMWLSSDQNGDGQYSLTDNNRGSRVTTAEADRLVEQNIVPHPSVVKIDVEGSELRVLEGMRTILQDINYLYLEIHPSKITDYGGNVHEIEEILSDSGLKHKKIYERGSEYFLRAQRS